VLWCGVLQNSEVSRLQSQLQSAGGQRQQLEQQMSTLTQQMTSAMASLGQLMQQQVGQHAVWHGRGAGHIHSTNPCGLGKDECAQSDTWLLGISSWAPAVASSVAGRLHAKYAK
jgi:hypothetical protein